MWNDQENHLGVENNKLEYEQVNLIPCKQIDKRIAQNKIPLARDK